MDCNTKLSNIKTECLPPKNNYKSKVHRNDGCPCGSGLKFKKCCINKNIFSYDPTPN